MKTNLEKILHQPSYWTEGINGILYNAIVEFMEKQDMNRTQLADYLGISKGRVSQILNDGKINFSIEKIVEISLKIGRFPVLELEDSKVYIKNINEFNKIKTIQLNDLNVYFEVIEPNSKLIKFSPKTNIKISAS